MFSTSASANHWKAFYLAALPKVNQALPLAAIRRLTGSELSPMNCFTKITREQGALFIMTVAPSKSELQLFHQPAILGGTLADNDLHCVALCGMESSANTVEFDLGSFTDLDLKTPSWTDLGQSTGDAEAFQGLKVSNDGDIADNFKGKNLVALPLPLAVAFVQSTKKDPTSIAMAFLKVMAEFDTRAEQSQPDEGDEIEMYCESFMHVIQFCWAAENDEVPAVTYWISESSSANEWNQFIHRNAILPRFISTAQLDTSPAITNGSNNTSIAYNLAYIKGQLEGKAASTETETKRGFKKLPKQVQRMILNASSIDAENAATDPTNELIEFLEQKNSGSARGTLQYQLEHEYATGFSPSQALASALHQGYFRWDRTDLPSNFSIFLCGNPPTLSTSSVSDSLNLAMKASEGKGLSETDIAKALKQVRSTPKDVYEAIDMLQNMYSICCLFFNKSSIMTQSIKSVIEHILRHKTHYEARQMNDSTFMTQVLQRLDLAIQLHLASCLHEESRGDVDDSCLDLKTDFGEILANKFKVEVFDCLKTKVIEPENRTNKRHGGKDDELFVQNKSINSSWKLRSNEQFSKVFHRHVEKCPKDNGNLICMRFFIKGSCLPSCKRLHQLSSDGAKKFDKFVKDCRASVNKKQKTNEKDQDFQEGAKED